MNKILSLAILAGGIVAIVRGLDLVDSVHWALSRFLAGSPPEPALWLLLGGSITVIIGSIGLFRSSRYPRF